VTSRTLWGYFFFIGFLALECIACYKRPLADDFDRYIYEALVRGKRESVEAVYAVIKHSNPRAEESSILDSPTHLGQLEPLYAIKPIYVKAIEATAFTRLSTQQRINLISALSLFGIGLVVLGWTARPLYAALLVATSEISVLGRMGTPDALSTLVVLLGLLAISRRKDFPGVLLLLVSIWIRTDNLLLALAVIAYLLWEKRVTLYQATILAAISVGSVFFINHFSGNYGWRILFQFSFLGGRSPAEVVPHFGMTQYLAIFIRSAETILPQSAIWILVGLAAWGWRSPDRPLLMLIWLTAAAHFALFPSPESRYLLWVFAATGAIFVSAVRQGARSAGTFARRY
jgi:hypothetical protein